MMKITCGIIFEERVENKKNKTMSDEVLKFKVLKKV